MRINGQITSGTFINISEKIGGPLQPKELRGTRCKILHHRVPQPGTSDYSWDVLNFNNCTYNWGIFKLEAPDGAIYDDVWLWSYDFVKISENEAVAEPISLAIEETLSIVGQQTHFNRHSLNNDFLLEKKIKALEERLSNLEAQMALILAMVQKDCLKSNLNLTSK